MKMLCVHHIIQYQYIDASGGFYSWLFVPERGGNRSTKPYLGTYLTSLSMACRESWFCATP